MQELNEYIHNYFEIQVKDLDAISPLFTIKSYKKGDYILKKSYYSVSLSFIKSGFIRVYGYNSAGNKEVTQWISGSGMFITDLGSLMFNQPARWNIMAITDCELYSISLENYRKINQYVQNWDGLEKRFIAKCFVTLENRVFDQLSLSAEEKVKALYKDNPSLFNQVPLHYIASMLGMTAETLSRVRRNLLS